MKNFKEYTTDWENMDESIMKEYSVNFEKTKLNGKPIGESPITTKARSSREAIIEAGKSEYNLSEKDSISLKSEVNIA